MKKWIFYFLTIFLLYNCVADKQTEKGNASSKSESIFTIESNEDGSTFQIINKETKQLVVTQNAAETHRPYLHPIKAPNSDVSLTEFSPDHHKHQTGLYWGFTRVNGTGIDDEGLKKWFYDRNKPKNIQQQIGRDFFHNPGEGYWQKVSSEIIIDEGEKVKWQTVYHMLDESGDPLLQETQTWTCREHNNTYLLDLEWNGKAIQDITVNQFDYGGLFLRMPWKKGVEGKAINAARQINEQAEGKRAMWVDVGMEIDGLDEWGHIAIFDHPENDGFPNQWRVDGQLGIGPVLSGQGDWTITKGDVITIQHEIVAFTGTMTDVQLKETWGDYVGDHGMYNTASLWGIAQQEARDAKFLEPQEAVDIMTIKEGYQVNTYASEPMITQPMAFCWDDRGRMWIAENRDYESRGYGFSNSGDSRILILEDTDHDGVVDQQKVFLEGIPFPAGIAVGFDGLYLGAPPNLLFVPDKDRDDKADVADIEVLLTGWGIRDRHETINSLHWGPDGWLYGLEGFATPSKIRKPIGKGKIYKADEDFPSDLLEANGVDVNGGVWRYHPIKDRFEVVAHGFSNPWGIDYDHKGQLFISACVIPHLFHIIPGGIYHRQGGKHFNPYVYEDIKTIVDHRHRSAHGGARIYQSDAFPEDQQGKIFMANIHEHAVLSDVLHPNGSGFTASHGEDFMLANNAQWIGFSMEIGPEGGLYVLDWHDADICGKEVLNKETGRVFRIMPEQTNASNWEGRFDDLNKMSSSELVNLQTSKSDWHTRRARVILQNRTRKNELDEDAVDRINEMFSNTSDDNIRLKILWTKHITNQLKTDELLELLKDKDPYIRAWSIQFLCEDLNPNQKVVDELSTLAKREKSAVARLYLAAAAQRIDTKDRWGILEHLIASKKDNDDPNIPLMLWYAIEPLVEEDPERFIVLTKKCNISSLAEKIARRMVDADQLELVLNHAIDKNFPQKEILLGVRAGLEGRTDVKEPDNWKAVYNQISTNKNVKDLAFDVAQQFGNAEAASQMMAILQNNNASVFQKQKAIQNLSDHKRTELAESLPELFKNSDIRKTVIRAMAAFDRENLGELLVSNYNILTTEEKQEAIHTLSARGGYGWRLANAIKDNEIPRKDIPAYIALQLRRVVGSGFVEIWGPIDDISGDIKADYNRYQRLLSNEAIAKADIENGKIMYQRTCYACHKMYGDGGILGPDLTGSNRGSTAYLLSNILEPSGEIQDDYKMVLITTQDGRTYTGNIVAENERQLTMRTVNQDAIAINKSDIQTKEVSPNSMMPQGLLKPLTDEEVVDLVAYLKRLES